MGLNIRQVITQKLEDLKDYIKTLESVAVAYSADTNSTFLLKTAKSVLKDKVIAISVKSDLVPQRELDEAIDFCQKEEIKQFFIETKALELEGYSQNSSNRCYICKKNLLEKISEVAKENGIKNIIEGSIIDEESSKNVMNAVEELGIKSPLNELKLTKDEIRILSRDLGLSTWNKPSFACLASSFVQGEEITKEKLNMVDKAEQMLIDLGFRQFRVRIHSKLARIEVARDEIPKLLSHREKITKRFKEIGFEYTTLDLNE